MKKQTCKIRQDILNNNLAVPIGNEWYGDKNPLPYRWRKDVFQVFSIINGNMQNPLILNFKQSVTN